MYSIAVGRPLCLLVRSPEKSMAAFWLRPIAMTGRYGVPLQRLDIQVTLSEDLLHRDGRLTCKPEHSGREQCI